MNNADRFRYRIEYAKTSVMRFTGHLDVLRAWERTFRRAALPLAFTQGFNPRPRINLVAALPLGFSSECELMDIWLLEDVQEYLLQQMIMDAVPPGLEIHQVLLIANDIPKLQKVIQAAEYYVQLDPSPATEQLQRNIDQLLDSTEITRTRRGKKYDLRPLIEALEMSHTEGDVKIQMRLSARDGATGRPEEVLLALGSDPSKATIHRSRLFLESK